MSHQVNHYEPPPLPRGSLAALPEYVLRKTSWNGLENMIPRIMEDFHVHPGLCIEFGVWHGYSTAALANNFQRVIGADVFYGDVIPGTEGMPMIETTRKSLAPWPNIELRECAMEDFDYTGLPIADLIHIDASHNYKDWFGVMKAVAHCRVAIFHDTGNWFVDVPRLVYEIADRFNLPHFHFPHHEGMDILVCANLLNAQDHVEIRHFTKQGFPIEGVVHVGANDGYEIPHYLNLGAKKIIAIEPQKRMCEILAHKFEGDPRVEVYQTALSDHMGCEQMLITQDTGMGSSLLIELPPPENSGFEANTIVGQEMVDVRRFDEMSIDHEGCNVLVMDVQGVELEALQGFGEKIKDFELLNIECSREAVYQGGATAQQVIDYLASHGFQQETEIKGHGDIMFRRRKPVIPGWNWDDRMLPLLEPHSYAQPPGPMVLGLVSGRHWKDDSGSWEQCVRSWDRNSLFRHPRYHVTGKPILVAYDEVHRNTTQEIIGLIHDDCTIYENSWDQRVLKQFEDPKVGIVGFFGATGQGPVDMYQTPFDPMQFARIDVHNNFQRDAEIHGRRDAGECDVVVFDGVALFIRRAILDNAGGWPQNCPVSYWMYDSWICAEARKQGYKLRYVGVACDHWASKTPSHRDENWLEAHMWIYERYRDVFPARVG